MKGWIVMHLYDYQINALNRIKNGSVICGDVGSGKSIVGLAYYLKNNGCIISNGKDNTMQDKIVQDRWCVSQNLYIITTAKKRDSHEWDKECARFLLSCDPEANIGNQKIIIDSWNNIKKYETVQNGFFIFDEQRLVGSGVWVKAFLNIAKHNEWILLTATPGDKWSDYIPIFIANGFYRNRAEFERLHIVYDRYSKFPKINKYAGVNKLINIKNNILVPMPCKKPAEANVEIKTHRYNKERYKEIISKRWDYEKEEPIATIGRCLYLARKVCNTDVEKMMRFGTILNHHPKIIVFYNFDYELEDLRDYLTNLNYPFAEWNGHKHQEIPEGDQWVYLVQYSSGCEGWNCVQTDTMIFYSLNYSYKIMYQAAGRIHRINTPYKYLNYYILKSDSPADNIIIEALKNKEEFNDSRFADRLGINENFVNQS